MQKDESWTKEKGNMKCECDGEEAVCKPGCDENASYRKGDNGMDCYCNDGFVGNGVKCDEDEEDEAEGGKTTTSDGEDDDG